MRVLKLLMITLIFVIPSIASSKYITWRTSNIAERTTFKETLSNLSSSNTKVDEITIKSDGQWIIIANDIVYTSSNFPSSVYNKVTQYINSGRTIDVVAFTPSGNWVVVAEDWLYRSGGLPSSNLLLEKVKSRQNAGHRIDELALTNNGWVIVSGGWVYAENMPQNLFDALVERDKSKRRINHISINSDNSWVLIADQWFASSGLSDQMIDHLQIWQANKRNFEHVTLASGNNFVMYGGNYSPKSDRMSQIEYQLGNNNDNVYQRMREQNIPGMSIAIIDNGKVTYQRGYGTLEKGTQKWVRSSSPFPVGSMSKYLASLGLMSLVDDNQIEVDTTIKEMEGQVASWVGLVEFYSDFFEVNNPMSPEVNLEMLLSHTAHFNNGATYIDPAHSTATYSTINYLMGWGCDSAGCAYKKNATPGWFDENMGNGHPGDIFKYSNKGYLAAQLMAETASNKTWPELMQNNILGPLGMTNSIYNEILPANWKARAAANHDGNGNPLPWYRIPNYAAGGLYASAADYAETMILLMKDGKKDRILTLPDGSKLNWPLQVISSSSVDEILKDRKPKDNSGGISGSLGGQSDMKHGYGLGVELQSSDNLNYQYFTHGGAVNGGGSCMEGEMKSKKGIVITINGPFTKNINFLRDLRQAFRKAYGLPLETVKFAQSC